MQTQTNLNRTKAPTRKRQRHTSTNYPTNTPKPQNHQLPTHKQSKLLLTIQLRTENRPNTSQHTTTMLPNVIVKPIIARQNNRLPQNVYYPKLALHNKHHNTNNPQHNLYPWPSPSDQRFENQRPNHILLARLNEYRTTRNVI